MEELYRLTIRRMNKRRIKYLVAGGIAVSLYGYNRTTEDIDFLIRADDENVKKFIDLMDKMGMNPAMPKNEEEIKSTVHTMFVSKHPGFYYFKIDMMGTSKRRFDALWKERKMFRYDNIKFPVISREDLIKLKRKSNRGKDQIDVAELEKRKI